jgi:uncharacterized protein
MSETSTAAFPGLLVEKDVAIEVRDGTALVADVFRPDDGEAAPVIMTLGPYPKDIHFKDWASRSFAGEREGRSPVYEALPEHGPYMHWETVNPEWWVPHGYAVVRVDARGTGKSPGRRNLLGGAEALDFYDCIEWAGAQPWSTGKVAVMGISYFAINAWRVGALQPPSLAAIVPWEGAVDAYRDIQRHGGIFSNVFTGRWGRNTTGRTAEAQHGIVPPEEYGPFHDDSNPDLAAIEVPLLSVGNWGGAGLHLRGNIEGFLGAGSEHKWLRVHSGDHVQPFYVLEGRLLQLRFLEQWLKGVDTGMTREPPIQLAIRRSREDYSWRYEHEWPLARTQWTRYHLDATDGGLRLSAPSAEGLAEYKAEPDDLEAMARFSTDPFDADTEITGPLSLHTWVSASVTDADLFVVIRNLAPDGREVHFQGSIPGSRRLAAAYGWQRLSHRGLDSDASTPWRPVHSHTGLEPVAPDEVVPVDIEIWPTSTVFAAGHRLVLDIRAHDDPGLMPFHHNHPADRRWGGINRIHTGPAHESYLLLPVIPPPV